MSLDNVEVIDAVGMETASHIVVLTIVDSWDWEDEKGHLVALQAKLNTYFEFIESRQIYESYPTAIGKILRIDIVSRFPISEVGQAFLKKASTVASELNVTVTNTVH